MNIMLWQIIAALGQNFLLIVDFVRSYAEVGEERESFEVDLPDVGDVSDVFNTLNTSLTFGSISLSGQSLGSDSLLNLETQ